MRFLRNSCTVVRVFFLLFLLYCHTSPPLFLANLESLIEGESLCYGLLNSCFRNLCMFKDTQILANDLPISSHIWYKTIAIQ